MPFILPNVSENDWKMIKCVAKILFYLQCYNKINPNKMRGVFDSYPLGESTFRLGASELIFNFISFFDEIHVSKQKSLKSDAAFCGVIYRTILFVYVP